MISKSDILLLLTDLEDKGINISKYTNTLFKTQELPLDVIKFINDNRQLDVLAFYELLRKNYNKKKSPLYKNIVTETLKDPQDVIVILSALALQISLFANKLEDNKLFLKHSRVIEITEALNNYYKNYDLIPCLKLLKLIKTDLKAFESIK